MQLFCFTYAGGTAAFYEELESVCEGIEFVKLEYPGHGHRRKEALKETIREVAKDLYEQICAAYTGEAYALMGYSMGSIVAFEMVQIIMRENVLPKPRHIFLAAHIPSKMTTVDGLSESELLDYAKKRTIVFGGVPKELQNNQTFWRIYLPLYIADYKMIGRYEFDGLEFTSDIPVTIFYSVEDTPRHDMERWKKFFVGECEMVEYTGTHFFLNEHTKEMAEVIKQQIGNDG